MKTGKITIKDNLQTNNISVQIELVDGNAWLTKHDIAYLFNVYIQTVSGNLREIFKDKELFEHEVVRRQNYTNEKGLLCTTEFYNLDVIIALAFRMKGGYCRLFREWIREQTKRPIIQNNQQPIIIQLGKDIFIS